MAKQFWLNLPVRDVKRSKEFFISLGFQFNTEHGDTDTSVGLLIGDQNVVVMLFNEPTFKNFVNNEVADTKSCTEVLLSIDAQSKEEVDEMAAKAVAAGGKTGHKPSEMNGWMYGCVFSDLDGHKWNVLHMDMSKMPQ